MLQASYQQEVAVSRKKVGRDVCKAQGNAPGWCRPFSADDVRDAVTRGVATGWHEAARLGC
ncbi:MAG: hypothetical protein RL153_1402, partial [Verrucomicrobiota bacterium]